MPSREEILEAVQVLSDRLLSLGVRSNVVAQRYTTRMRDAEANAGQNVHAVGVGKKEVNGIVTDTTAIRIHIIQKLAKSAMPPRFVIPEEIDGIPTDIIQSPPAFILPARGRASKAKGGARAVTKRSAKKGGYTKRDEGSEPVSISAASCSDNRQSRQRPIIGGISVAHRNVTAGTIAYFCRSTMSGDDPSTVFILSNNHVLADVNQAVAGDDVYQPGPADGGTFTDHAADLHRFVQIRLGGDLPNRVDAAIARLRSGTEHTLSLCSIGQITGIDRAVEQMRVRKHGRTTGLTEGIVTDNPYNATVGMDHNNPAVVARFQGQMRIQRAGSSTVIGLGGDSGSLVVRQDNGLAVGLYFAGPPSGIYGIANHIDDVISELQIELLV